MGGSFPDLAVGCKQVLGLARIMSFQTLHQLDAHLMMQHLRGHTPDGRQSMLHGCLGSAGKEVPVQFGNLFFVH